jgi:hypothetical protein
VFFAATLDATTGDVKFYKGTTTSAVAAAGGSTVGALIGSAITMSDRNFYVGNSGSESSAWLQGRAFLGSLDNVRVFSSVLDSEALESFRQADLSPVIVPEPSSGLMLLAIVTALQWQRRRPRGGRRLHVL